MNKDKPILIACEESGIVTAEFIKLGFTNVFSCDLMETSGDYPERHIVGDVLPLLDGFCKFRTSDGKEHEVDTKFWLIIAFPPCTDLAVSGARHFERKRADGSQQKSIDFFMRIANADCKHIMIENPVGIMSTQWRKPDQIIQPFYFGDPHKKTTCLWLKGLPKLQHTDVVEVCDLRTYDCKNGKKAVFSDWINKGGKDRQKLRSKTFPGFAKTIAKQYSEYLEKERD